MQRATVPPRFAEFSYSIKNNHMILINKYTIKGQYSIHTLPCLHLITNVRYSLTFRICNSHIAHFAKTMNEGFYVKYQRIKF